MHQLKASSKPLRIFLYCHDSAGIGHLRRTLNIGEVLKKTFPSASILVATGCRYMSLFDSVRTMDWLKLPTLVKSSTGEYGCRSIDMTLEHLIAWRSESLLSCMQHFRPDMVLIDKAPVGVCGEMRASLDWLKRRRRETRVVLGLRDIEDSPKQTIKQWSRLDAFSALERLYDEIWVYGNQEVFDPIERYRLSDAIAERLKFVGYVCPTPCTHEHGERTNSKQVLLTVGGGTDGALLVETYLEQAAQHVADAGGHTLIVAGPDFDDRDATRLRRMQENLPATEWRSFDPCMMCRLRESRLAVSMGGYNTLCEIASTRTPALVVPRIHPRLEQEIRAMAWRDRNIIEMCDPRQLSPSKLAHQVLRLFHQIPEMNGHGLNLGGLDRIVSQTRNLLQPESTHEIALRV